MYQRALAKLAKQWRTGAIQGHGQAYFKMLSVTMFSSATWSSREGKALQLLLPRFHFFILFFFFFFPPNFCALLALDTGHLRVPVIHEDMRRYLNHQELSAGGISTRSLFSQCINIPQCRHYVTRPYICASTLVKPAASSRKAERFSTSYIRSTLQLNLEQLAKWQKCFSLASYS